MRVVAIQMLTQTDLDQSLLANVVLLQWQHLYCKKIATKLTFIWLVPF